MIKHSCPHCGASMKKSVHTLNKTLLNALSKMIAYKRMIGENDIDRKKMSLTTHKLTNDEHTNVTKLRFHALIAHYKENGKIKKGHWVVTSRGFSFMAGKIQIPIQVKTFRNVVVERSEDMVTIKDFDILPTHEEIEETIGPPATEKEIEYAQSYKRKKKKTSTLCPRCSKPMKKRGDFSMNKDTQTVSLNGYYHHCTECGYKTPTFL